MFIEPLLMVLKTLKICNLLRPRHFVVHAVPAFSLSSIKDDAVKLRDGCRLLCGLILRVVAEESAISTRRVIFGHQHLVGWLNVLTYGLDWRQRYGSFSSHSMCAVTRLIAIHAWSRVSSVFVCSDIVPGFRKHVRIHLYVLLYDNIINSSQRLGVQQKCKVVESFQRR